MNSAKYTQGSREAGNAQKMMFRKSNTIPNCPQPDLDKKNSDFREKGKWKTVVVYGLPNAGLGNKE